MSFGQQKRDCCWGSWCRNLWMKIILDWADIRFVINSPWISRGRLPPFFEKGARKFKEDVTDRVKLTSGFWSSSWKMMTDDTRWPLGKRKITRLTSAMRSKNYLISEPATLEIGVINDSHLTIILKSPSTKLITPKQNNFRLTVAILLSGGWRRIWILWLWATGNRQKITSIADTCLKLIVDMFNDRSAKFQTFQWEVQR